MGGYYSAGHLLIGCTSVYVYVCSRGATTAYKNNGPGRGEKLKRHKFPMSYGAVRQLSNLTYRMIPLRSPADEFLDNMLSNNSPFFRRLQSLFCFPHTINRPCLDSKSQPLHQAEGRIFPQYDVLRAYIQQQLLFQWLHSCFCFFSPLIMLYYISEGSLPLNNR